MKKILPILAVVILSLSLFTACDEKKPFTVALAAYPTDTEYAIGESFRYDGLVLIVTHSDGSLEEVAVTEDMVTFSAESAGGAVARIAYTYNGYTATVYVNTVVRDTMREYKNAAIAVMGESSYYKEHKDDFGILSLYENAVNEIASAATASEVGEIRDRFLSELALLFSDKSEAEALVYAIDLSGLPSEIRVMAECDRAETLFAISLAETPTLAMAHAKLYKEAVDRYVAHAKDILSGDVKAELYLSLRDYYQQQVLGNREMYDNDTLLHLTSLYDAAGLRILMATAQSEAEAIVEETKALTALSKTRIDLVHDALAAVYKNAAVTYTDDCLRAIEKAELALETALTLPEDKCTVLFAYGAAFENRIDGLTYIEGKIDLVSAVAAARERYEILKTADANAEVVRVAIGEIGVVDLAAEVRILAAENAYNRWIADNAIDEENRGNAIIGAAYDTMIEARTAYDAIVALAKERAAIVMAKITAIKKLTLGSDPLITEAEAEYESYSLHYVGFEDYVDVYVTNLATLLEARRLFEDLLIAAKADSEALKAYKSILSSGAYLSGKAGEEKILEAEAAYAAFLKNYGEDHVAEYIGLDLLPVIKTARAAYDALVAAALADADLLKAYKEIFAGEDYLSGKAGEELILDAEVAYEAFLKKYGEDYLAIYVGLDVLPAIEAARAAYDALVAAATADGNALKAYVGIFAAEEYLSGKAGEEKILEAEALYAAFLENYGKDYVSTYVGLDVLPAIEAARAAHDAFIAAAVQDGELLKTYRDVLCGEEYLNGTAGEEIILAAEAAYAAFLEKYGEDYIEAFVGTDVLPAIEAARLAYRLHLFDEAKTGARNALRESYNALQSSVDVSQLELLLPVYTAWNGTIESVTFSEWDANASVFETHLAAAQTAMQEALVSAGSQAPEDPAA